MYNLGYTYEDFPTGSLWQFTNCPNPYLESMFLLIESKHGNVLFCLHQRKLDHLNDQIYDWIENTFSVDSLPKYAKRIA
jgi:hypothetical protein